MIVLLTARGHGATLRCLTRQEFGVPVPRFRQVSYDVVFRAWRLPRATYIFGDLERLAPWELRIAAGLYRALTTAGVRCLNDPAQAMARVELLLALRVADINPFSIFRADERPRPARFPVFLRTEGDHEKAPPDLYDGQDALDRALASRRDAGMPLRGLLVIEFCGQPYGNGLWAKWGTFRIGAAVIVTHIVVDDHWLVKAGDARKLTDAIFQHEHDVVASGAVSAEVRSAFEISRIEFGRADHAEVDGRHVVYEINMNPFMSRLGPGPPLWRQTQMILRQRMADALAAIDTEPGRPIPIGRIPGNSRRVRWRLGLTTMPRP